MLTCQPRTHTRDHQSMKLTSQRASFGLCCALPHCPLLPSPRVPPREDCPGTVPVLNARGQGMTAAFLLSTPSGARSSMMAGQELKTRHGENIYTTEMGRCYKSGLCPLPPPSQVGNPYHCTTASLLWKPCIRWLSLGVAFCLEDAFVEWGSTRRRSPAGCKPALV